MDFHFIESWETFLSAPFHTLRKTKNTFHWKLDDILSVPEIKGNSLAWSSAGWPLNLNAATFVPIIIYLQSVTPFLLWSNNRISFLLYTILCWSLHFLHRTSHPFHFPHPIQPVTHPSLCLSVVLILRMPILWLWMNDWLHVQWVGEWTIEWSSPHIHP